jgi:hypothetical protein
MRRQRAKIRSNALGQHFAHWICSPPRSSGSLRGDPRPQLGYRIDTLLDLLARVGACGALVRLVPGEGEASGIEATAPAVRKKRSQSAAFVHVESAQRTCVAVGPGRLQVGSDEAIERTARRSLAMDPDGAGFRIPGPSSPRSSPQHPDRAVSMPFLSDH